MAQGPGAHDRSPISLSLIIIARMEPEPAEEFARRVLRARDAVAKRLPDSDPGDLLLIVESLLARGRPLRCFVRPIEGGGHVP